ncbi:hypothetical protein [Rubellicoccus peritrichatus]|uniref:Uncharacterized protein n=1 Tax=Rubellicoccus peritrichatus TaxID=3080537 RepID=A0AAQ3QU45_9BACT|nr:hypothetical protein [Puniceicoccus sp. CR14]WOO40083.1 hypothetical protein RZN69_15785 [Puniceicoccus sp. CR14]
MRHIDPKLTSQIYTDAEQLPTFDAVRFLPFDNQCSGAWTQIGTQKPDFSGLSQSQTVKINCRNNNSETIDNKVDSLNLSGADTHCPMVPGEGLEPATPNLQVVVNHETSSKSPAPLTQIGTQEIGANCPRLVRIVKNWEHLPESLKTAIVAISESHFK